MSLIEMKGITKKYPNTIALDKVDFHLDKGEIVSLLGENGAGKTTLMKILYGMTRPDEGRIFFNGERLEMKSPLDAISHHVCMVHQHFMLVPAFSVVENIIVGQEPGKAIAVDMKKAREEVSALIRRFDFKIDPDKKAGKLSVGEQQRVEILKALYRRVDVLILDEPTAVLTPQEVNELFDILRQLRSEGKSIIIITHKLKETMALADRIVVLRDGRLVADDIRPEDVTTEDLSSFMVGRNVDLQIRHPSKVKGRIRLKVENLSVSENGVKKVDDVSFELHEGEILGVAGIEGNGQSELIESLVGLRTPDSMRFILDGEEISGKCDKFISHGIGHVPEDRLTLGLVKEMSIKENIILGYHKRKEFSSKGMMNFREIDRFSEENKASYLIKAPSIETPAGSLSGGNQQKVVIARVFSENPSVLIAAHPTRGVDIGATEYIHNKFYELRDKGTAIFLVSADLDEVCTLSDRLLVIYGGRIVAEGKTEDFSQTELGLFMAGAAGKNEKSEASDERI